MLRGRASAERVVALGHSFGAGAAQAQVQVHQAGQWRGKGNGKKRWRWLLLSADGVRASQRTCMTRSPRLQLTPGVHRHGRFRSLFTMSFHETPPTAAANRF